MEFLFGLDMLRKHHRRTFHLGCWMKRGMPRRLLLLVQKLRKHLDIRRRVIHQPEVLLGPDFEAKVTKLVELGFGRAAVNQALKFFDGNEEQAAAYLFGG